MVSIRIDHLWKYFSSEQSPAIGDLSLDIADRDFLVLVGPSGCGKTTTLRILAGLDFASHGRIWMDEKDITNMSPGQRDIAMVFQSYALYPNMTVYENLAFGPRVRREPKGDISRRVQEVAAALDMGDLLSRHPSELSGGQRQRVALGRAMIREPKVFLMDEPLSNLDAALRVQMRAELVRLHKRQEVTTVYVTHDQVEALTMGNRVAVLDKGRLLQVDTPTNLYERPASLFVATFIGSPQMNVVPGTVVTGDGGPAVHALGVSWPVTVDQRPADLAPRDRVTVGIRPHDIHVTDSLRTSDVLLRGTVDIFEHSGAELFVTVSIGDQLIKARLPRSTVVQPGDALELAFAPSDVHLFDTDSQEAL